MGIQLVDVNIAVNLLIQASLHASLVRSPSIFEAEGHRDVAESVVRGSERRLKLVRLSHFDLVVPRVCVWKTQQLRAGRGIDSLIYVRLSKVVLRKTLVQAGVVDTHP